MFIKQEDDEQSILQQTIKSLRTQTSQKFWKRKLAFENNSYGDEIREKQVRRTSILFLNCYFFNDWISEH
jgi:hypothetical protein